MAKGGRLWQLRAVPELGGGSDDRGVCRESSEGSIWGDGRDGCGGMGVAVRRRAELWRAAEWCGGLWRGAIKAIDTQSSGVDGVRCWLRPGLSSERWTPRKVFR